MKFRIEEALHVIEVEEKISKFCKRMAEFVPGLMPETRDLNELILSDLCTPRRISEEKNICRISEVTDDHLQIIDKYLDLRKQSSLFRKEQSRAIQDLDQESSLEQVLDFVNDLMETFQGFIDKLFGSKITVRETQEKFTDLHVKGEIEEEIEVLRDFFKKKGFKLANQINTMFKLAKIKGSAEAMKKVAEFLKAATDLSPVQKIIDSDESADMLLGKALSKEVLDAGRCFEKWQPDQIKSLEKLDKCQKLMLWLKDNIKSSQQLKNFVELAGISAGESDDEVFLIFKRMF